MWSGREITVKTVKFIKGHLIDKFVCNSLKTISNHTQFAKLTPKYSRIKKTYKKTINCIDK